MVFIDLNLDQLQRADGRIAYIHPNVKIGVDVDDNIDLVKLREFKNQLQEYLEYGLNKCLIERKKQ